MVRLTLPYGPCTVATVPSASVEKTDCVVPDASGSVDVSGAAVVAAPHPHNNVPVSKIGKIFLFIVFYPLYLICVFGGKICCICTTKTFLLSYFLMLDSSFRF
jgi:hypothetical protein